MIAFCGVWFMAETAKVLNPGRVVVVPDREAGCSLVDSCPVEPVREFRREHPEYEIVSYINTSIEVKAESDILCTSRNAVKIVNSIPREKPVLFLPDRNLGNYVQQADGAQEHEDLAGDLHRACDVPGAAGGWRLRSAHPQAQIAAHPGVSAESVLAMADFIGSTSAIIDWCAASDAARIHHHDGERDPLFAGKVAPRKRFYFVANENCNCSECPYMKLNTLEKLRDAWCDLEPRVEIAPELMRRALRPMERMLHGDLMAETGPLIDSFGRVHDNLRLSVTDRCNIRCFYCMPETDVKFMSREEILDFEEIERFARIAAGLGDRTSCG